MTTMVENNKRSLSDDVSSPNRKPSSAKKADNKVSPNKENAKSAGLKMMETDNMEDLATTITTEISLIQQDDSIWSHTSDDKDELSDGTEVIQFDDFKTEEETSTESDLTDEQVQDILMSFGKIGFVTHNDDDSIIQALANFFGYQLFSDNLNQKLIMSYLVAHQEWFKTNHNEKDRLDTGHYKILAKCLGMTAKRFKKLSTGQIKKKVTKKFLSIDVTQEYSVAHVQHLSKINGIFFPKGTISDSGKQSLINRMVNSIDLKKHSIVSTDKFSTQKILGFISNSNKGNHPVTNLNNPYAKTPKKNNNPHSTPTTANAATTPSQPVHNGNELRRPPNTNIRAIATTAPTTGTLGQATVNPTTQTDADGTGSHQRRPIPTNPHNTNQTNQNNTTTTVNGGILEPEPIEEIQHENIATRFSRIELRLCMQPNDNENGDVNQLRRQLQEVIQQLLTVDPHIRFWSWYERSNDSHLNITNIPRDIRSINRYFNRIAPSQFGMVHGEFRMEHSRRWEDIIYDLTPWLSENRHGLYYQHLQCPSTTNLGWLLWSFRKIDVAVLQMELLLNHHINVVLRYQNIVLNRGTSTPATDKVMALHVISDKRDADKVAAKLKEIYPYGKISPSFPLGIVMRFIPHIFRVKRDKFQKIAQLRARQNTFLTAIEDPVRPMNATSWEILTLDTNHASFGTLRNRLMDVTSRDRPNDKLFLSVDTSYFRSNEVIFTFLPRNETEARAFVTNIVPFFLHSYDEEMLTHFFHSEAIMRAKSVIWNADTREVESADDAYLNNGGDDIDDFDIFDSMEITESTGANCNTHTDRVERLFYGEESDSIGTLFTNNQQRVINTSPSNQFVGHLQTPVTQNRSNGVTPSTSSIGGQSSGTIFTNEEATAQIILLTNGFRNIEMMFMAVMQQQGIQIPSNILNNTNRNNNNNPTNNTHLTESSTGAHADVAMHNNHLELVDQQVDQEQP